MAGPKFGDFLLGTAYAASFSCDTVHACVWSCGMALLLYVAYYGNMQTCFVNIIALGWDPNGMPIIQPNN